MFRKAVALLAALVLLSGCSEVKTSDAQEAYCYWAGTRYWPGSQSPADMEVLAGQYWRSPHFTLEHEVFLKLKPTKEWWDAFVEQNGLVKNDTPWVTPKNLPDWFQPSEKSIRYHRPNYSARSFHDPETGIVYIYELIL